MTQEEQLVAAADAADEAHLELDAAVEREVREATFAIRKSYRGQLSAASEASADAHRKLRDYRSDNASHPLEGKRVWRMQKDYGNWALRPTYDSQQFGIVEVVRIGTKFAENLPRYREPRIGQVIVRIIKKDGTPGLKFECSLNGWTEEVAS